MTRASCSHTYTCASATKQYNLVLAEGQRCTVAVKITIGWPLHWPSLWPCITNLVVYPPTGLCGLRQHPTYPLHINYKGQLNNTQNMLVYLRLKILWRNALLFWQIANVSRFSSIKWLMFTPAAQTTQCFTEYTIARCLATASRTNQQHTTARCAQTRTQLMNLTHQPCSCQ